MRTRKVVIVINEQHKLLPEQEQIVSRFSGTHDTIRVPADGWSLEEQTQICNKIITDSWKFNRISIVFVSPVPAMISRLSYASAMRNSWYRENGTRDEPRNQINPLIFCNDTREKKELPDGRIISVVSRIGWYLISPDGEMVEV